MTELITWDSETYPNFFSCAARRLSDGAEWIFEISDRQNQAVDLYNFILALSNTGAKMVGFNNVGFDYPILHMLMTTGGTATGKQLYDKAMSIITSGRNSFGHMVWEKERWVPQIDLFKIHHFDNMAKSTSLKMLEFNMRSPNIEDLPFPPGTVLTDEQKDVVLTYNMHDVRETEKFYFKSTHQINFRDELSAKYGKDFTNFNDTKIGKEYFIMRLEEQMPGCTRDESGIRQTKRPTIDLGQAVFPSIHFENPEFNRIKNWLASQTIVETKGTFKDLSCTVRGFQFDFGLGGIHGSIDSATVHSDCHHVILDLDVASYYPNIAIANRCYPEHLGEAFCDIYQDVYNQRKAYKKGTPENAMLKLALNGTYGDSNNKYSCFYDPLYTMKITINGQLLLCMLAEWLMSLPELKMIQINTDGLTVRIPRRLTGLVEFISKEWERYTGLELESAEYSRMMIRDVNNYIAEYPGGKLKRKGAYGHETPLENPYTQEVEWHKNHSALVIPKAAEAALVHGKDIDSFIRNHQDLYDFMLRTKVPRSSRLALHETVEGIGEIDHPLQNITRYYVSKSIGPDVMHSLVKIMPPTPMQKAKNPAAPDRRIGVTVGWNITPCNNIKDATAPIDYDYYISETKKLVEPLQ